MQRNSWQPGSDFDRPIGQPLPFDGAGDAVSCRHFSEVTALMRDVRCRGKIGSRFPGQAGPLLTDIVAKVPKGAAANFPPKNETSDNRRSIGLSNTLPESPVSLALGDVVPHITIQSLHLGSENLSPTSQKDFCNNIDPYRKSTTRNGASARVQFWPPARARYQTLIRRITRLAGRSSGSRRRSRSRRATLSWSSLSLRSNNLTRILWRSCHSRRAAQRPTMFARIGCDLVHILDPR